MHLFFNTTISWQLYYYSYIINNSSRRFWKCLHVCQSYFTPFYLNDKVHLSWHGLREFVQNRMIPFRLIHRIEFRLNQSNVVWAPALIEEIWHREKLNITICLHLNRDLELVQYLKYSRYETFTFLFHYILFDHNFK